MNKTYQQYRSAFKNVSAYIVLHRDAKVATITFKNPTHEKGRLYAYIQWMDTDMRRSFASGTGYDKHTSACAYVIYDMFPGPAGSAHLMAMPDTPFARFARALEVEEGRSWDDALRRAGFEIFQAV